MILVADSGSTKTNWCLLNHDTPSLYFDTEGYNPYFATSQDIALSLERQLPEKLDRTAVSEIFFYGAGCFDDKTAIVSNALARIFEKAAVSVHLDLLASARATLGDTPGFVAILGTGANSCLYDGQKIVSNIDSLGFLLGDEGSGFYLGRKLLGDYIRGYMPIAVQHEFFARYGHTRVEIMDKVYSEVLPNRFCAGFASFLRDSVNGGDYARETVRAAFRDFFDHLVCHYDDYACYTFNCVGSIGHAWRDVLSEVAASYGMRTGIILKAPIGALAEYHLNYARRF